MPIINTSVTVDAEKAGRVDLIVREMTETSRSQVKGMIDQGCVSVNGNKVRSVATTVKEGDLVALKYDPAQRYKEKKRKWDDRTFSIVFEDDHLIVVDKAAGTLTVPTDNGEPNSLQERVSIYLSHSKRIKEACVVHRLDRDVSGLLVFGKHQPIADALAEQFKQLKPQRIYTVIVGGLVTEDEGQLRSYLATGANLDRFVTSQNKDSELAITNYKVIKRFKNTTLMECTLETGKRSQLRVQLADIDHPVLGDTRYKPKLARHNRWVRKRMAIHARTLGFTHPITGEELMLDSVLPPALHKFIVGDR